MDIEKLIERLRTESLYKDKATLEIMDLCMDAATALSTMKKYCNSVCGHLNEAEALNRKLQTENEKLRAEMEQVKRERDTAIEQLHGICDACQHYTPYHNRGKCASCEHEIVRDPKIPPVDNWEWRGPKEG